MCWPVVFMTLMVVTVTVTTSHGEDFLVVDNFEYGVEKFGTRDDMVVYVTLAEDPVSNLSTSFTICSSIKVGFLVTAQPFFILWSEDKESVLLNLSFIWNETQICFLM